MDFAYFGIILYLSIILNTVGQKLAVDYDLLEIARVNASESLLDSDDYYTFVEDEKKAIALPISMTSLEGETLHASFIIQAVFKFDKIPDECTLFSIVRNDEDILLDVTFSPQSEDIVRIELRSDKLFKDEEIFFDFEEDFDTSLLRKTELLIQVEESKVKFFINCKETKNLAIKNSNDKIQFEDSILYLGTPISKDQFFPGKVQTLKIYFNGDERLQKQICVDDAPHTESLVRENFTDFSSVGQKGEKGDRGEKGDSISVKGAPGARGATGPKGDKGERGDTTHSVGPPGMRGEKGDKGDLGNQGIKGEQGASRIGPQGPQGLVGAKGFPGPKGEEGNCSCTESVVSKLIKEMPEMRGPEGPKGSRGIEGAPGTTGLTGQKGEKGDIGIRGERGERGERGDDGTHGRHGERGPKGDPGNDGSDGDPGPAGPPGPPGPPGPTYKETESEKVTIPGEKGEPGPIGPPGPHGHKGEQGDKGEIGEPGDKGDRGHRGETGEKGFRGDKGEKGDNGRDGLPGNHGRPADKGEKGDSGVKGERGEPGRPASINDLFDDHLELVDNKILSEKLGGMKGEPGSRGDKGDKGDTGATGRTGDPGSRGETGLQGNKGDRGPVGPSGSKGSPGQKGPRGYKGPAGKPGTTGATGPKGEKGDSGASGYFNVTQVKGEKGDRGIQGLQGTPGQQGPPGVCTDGNRPVDMSDFLTSSTLIYHGTLATLIKKTSTISTGTLVYIYQENILVIKAKNEFKNVVLQPLIDPQPPTQPYPVTEPSSPIRHHKLYIRMIALNHPYSGKFVNTRQGLAGGRAADEECRMQARLRFGSNDESYNNFRAFLNYDYMENMLQKKFHDLPVMNLRNEIMFDSWRSIFNGSGAPFEKNIYSFDGLNIALEKTWRTRAVWHGYNMDAPTKSSTCDRWQSNSSSLYSFASPLGKSYNKLLAQEPYKCDSQLIVLCVDTHPKEITRRRRHLGSRLQGRHRNRIHQRNAYTLK